MPKSLPGTGFVFVPDKDLERELPRDTSLVPSLQKLADSAAKAAQQFAPVRLQKYRESIEGVAGVRDDGIVVGRVLSTDFKANWIEKGTGEPAPTPAFAPLRRGVEATVGTVR